MQLDVYKKLNQVSHFQVTVNEDEQEDFSEFGALTTGYNSWVIPISELRDFWQRYGYKIIASAELLTYAVLAGIISSNFGERNTIIVGEANLKPLELAANSMGYSEQYDMLMMHQKVGAARILEKDAILIADVMGLGKTLTAIFGMVVDPSIKKTLIICPSTMKYVWQKEIHYWFPDQTISVVDGPFVKRFQQYAADVNFVITSYDLIRRAEDTAILNYLRENGPYKYSLVQSKNKFFNIPVYPYQEGKELFQYSVSWEVKKGKKVIAEKFQSAEYKGKIIIGKKVGPLVFDALVLDEAHHIKNPTAEQTKAIHSLSYINKKILLTGTPIMNKIEDMWSMLYMIEPYRFSNFWAFRNQYCIFKDIVTKQDKKIRLIVGYKNTDQLQKQLAGIMLRRDKYNTLKDLPPKTNEVREIELSSEQKKLYKSFAEEISVWIDERNEEIEVHQALDKMLRLKQVAITPELFGGSTSSSKLDELEEIVDEITSNGEKVIVFSQFKTATNIIKKRLLKKGYTNKNIAYISGDVPMKVSAAALAKGKTDRMEEIRRFQEDDDCKIFVGVIDACKEGITLTAAKYVVFVDKSWTPADNEQAEARAHRNGQKNPVTVISLVAKDTVEEYIEEKLQEKMNLFDQIIEGTVRHQNTISEVKKMLKMSKKND